MERTTGVAGDDNVAARTKVAVLGLGYVGLPLAVRAAEVGLDVVGYDPDEGKVESLQHGVSYVEDIGDNRLSQLTSFEPTSDVHELREFDVAVITVPTPLRAGAPDLSFVESATRTLADHLRPGAMVVLESTTYPGTTERLVADILLDLTGLRAGRDFHLGFSPERIDPGNREFTFETTPKIVSGTTVEALDAVDAFYSQLVATTVRVSATKVAELAKLLENTFRHVNIALVNEMAILAHDLGIDVWEAIDAAATKPFGFMKFTPGPGVGGHCLPIDPAYLSWAVRTELDKSFRFVELAVDINNHMPDYVVSRAGELLNSRRMCLNGARIGVLGVAYKPGTSDVRESPAERMVELLAHQGAEVWVSDPHVIDWNRSPRVEFESLYDALVETDLVILVTDHEEFDYGKIAEFSPLLLDCRNRFDSAAHIAKL
ncbi:nucleotide sugar dehydrogenase [Nocardioides caldifontis]|uniref:nucleotide sugar dehydrogenase n=1 Tax=Nocardioides caldifontis TaxID=2588938 RepID=UPI0011DF58A6|nr:nucleotide sugar dehydrogenase [Nocardioides caldifontis]